MASLHGIPLLSGPPPTSESGEACRKCNREFNILFTRSRRCNHCGHSYCHSCSDYQALMPRSGPERGYDPVHVCTYCIELLNITAAGPGQLRGMSLGKLKSYADAYSIDISRAVEKGDIVESIIRVREHNGCLPRSKENFYRKNKVPNPHTGSRPRGIFSRSNLNQPPPVPPRPQAQTGNNFPRPDINMNDTPNSTPPRPQTNIPPQPQVPPRTQYQYPPHYGGAPPHQQPPPPPQQPHGHYAPPYQPHAPNYHTQQQHFNVPPYHQPHSQPQHQARPPPPPPPQETRPPPPRPSTTSSTYRHAAQSYTDSTPPPPPPRQRTASTPPRPPPPPAPTTPLPTLDQLLAMTQASISALPISVLKNILFTNHVNASMILEKSELVKKVMTLIDDERRERERQRMAEEVERLEEEERRREREEAIHRQQEENRRREEEERLRKERRERQRARVEEVEDGVDDMMDIEVEVETSDNEDEDEDEPLGNVGRAESGGDRPTTPMAAPSSAQNTLPKPSPTPQKSPMMATLERTGLCVICQDEEANIAIVDCGHLAMCRACSELVMASSRECPLCRTRIVTEARLLRIFKT